MSPWMTPVTHHIILTPSPRTTGLRCLMSVPEPTSGQIQTFAAKFLFIYELHVACYPQAACKGHAVIKPSKVDSAVALARTLSHGNSRCGWMLHTGACPCIGCATTASLPVWSLGLCLQKGWNLLLMKFPPSTAEATGKVLQASNVFCTLPQKGQTLSFPTLREGVSLSAVLLLMLRRVGMNQKVAKFICLIFQGSKNWVDSSNPCFPSLRGV